MLRRVALVLLLLAVTTVTAMLAAGHLGINLPWQIAATDPEQPSKDRDEAAPASAAKPPETVIDETVAALGTGPEAAAPAPGSVAIDISRISPDGTSVFAGRAAPDSYVTVLENGKPAGTVKADSYGEWSLSTDHKFASTDPRLTYEVSRTPPPAPEPPKQEVAKADPAPTSVAGEVMRKFENMVEEAREEAKKEAEQAEAAAKTEPPAPDASNESTPPEQSAAAAPEEADDDAAVASAPELDVEPAPHADAANEPPAAPVERHADATVTVVPQQESPKTSSANASPGVKTDIIPVPLMFVYNEATLTPEGERAASLLLEYLTLKRLSAVELTGHADERGTDQYNYDLSRERLETVARLLKDGGFSGELTLSPKGKSEPYTGVDRSSYPREALYQLDRRVELRLTR